MKFVIVAQGMIGTAVTIGIPDFLTALGIIVAVVWLWRLPSTRGRLLVRQIVFGTLALFFDTYAAWGIIVTIFRPLSLPAHYVLQDWTVFLLSAALGLFFSWRFAVWLKQPIRE